MWSIFNVSRYRGYKMKVRYYSIGWCYILVYVLDEKRGKVEITPVAGDDTVIWVSPDQLFESTK